MKKYILILSLLFLYACDDSKLSGVVLGTRAMSVEFICSINDIKYSEEFNGYKVYISRQNFKWVNRTIKDKSLIKTEIALMTKKVVDYQMANCR